MPAGFRFFRNSFFAFYFLALPLLGFPQAALAYHLGDHVTITRLAIQEFQKCYPQVITSQEPFFIFSSDLEEDINVIRKDFIYSHYFNPQKSLSMFRYDSSVRVQRLSLALKTDQNSLLRYIHLGHALHHIQDVSVPVHVVPITHGLSDKFENYKLKSPLLSTGLTCQELENLAQETRELPELLVLTANQSLETLAQILVPITKIDSSGQQTYKVNGSSFWKIAPGNNFGSYGLLGQHFGESEIQFSQSKVLVPTEFYENFKRQQMISSAIRSWIVLYQFHKPTSLALSNKLASHEVSPLSLFQMQSFEALAKSFSF